MKMLMKYHSALYVSNTAPFVYDLDASAAEGYNQGWRKLDNTTFCSELIIDLAGLSLEDETVFFDGIMCQEAGPTGITGAAGDSMLVYDIVATVPLDITNDYGKIILFGAGFPQGVGDFMHLPYVRWTRYTLDLDTNARFAFKAQSEQSGSMEATASDRLYVYRIVFISSGTTGSPPANTLEFAGTAGARILCAVNTKKEADYEHIMRLKRSFDLQNEPDVDKT